MPLVLHPSSHCDVCLDSWNPPEHSPFAIACGHIFCQTCLIQLEHRICPLCRKAFTLERIKKLHVDLPDPGELSPDPALQLLQRLALISVQDTPSEEFVEVVEQAKTFISSHEQDPSCPPLTAAVEALGRFNALREELETLALLHHEKKRSWRHKVEIARADVQTLRTTESNLLEKLQKVDSEYQATRVKLAETENEVKRLRAGMGRYGAVSNPLPPPPEPVSLDVVPPLRTYGTRGPYNTAPVNRNHRRGDSWADSDGFLTNGHPATDIRARSEKPLWRQEPPPPMPETIQDWPQSSIRPGAPPTQRVIPQAPTAPFPHSSKGKSKETEAAAPNGPFDWSTQRHPDRRGMPSRSYSDVDGRHKKRAESLDTSHAMHPGYYDGQARYPSGYAPNYQDRHHHSVPSPPPLHAPTHEESGLGLEGVPDIKTGSVTSRSSLFQLHSAGNDSELRSTENLTLLQATRRSPSAPTQTVSEVLSVPSVRHNIGGPRDLRRNNSNSAMTVSSWGTIQTENLGTGRGSLGSLDLLNNLDNVALTQSYLAGRLPGEDRNSRFGTPQALLPVQGPEPLPSMAATLQRMALETQEHSSRHSRSQSQPVINPEGGNPANPQGPLPSSRDRHPLRADLSSQEVASQQPDPAQYPPLTSSPENTNTLALTLGPPHTTVPIASQSQPSANAGDQGQPRIYAPTPRASQNPVRNWKIGH